MKIEEVRKLPVQQRLAYWIRERHQIRLRRPGTPRPWTDDEILMDYKFCNVRREHDKVSQWLNQHWYYPNKDHPNMLVACALARQLNIIEALEAVGFPKVWEPEKFKKILEDRAAAGKKNYSAAYMITARYGRNRAPETKPYQTLYRVCDPLYRAKPKMNTDSMEACWKTLMPFQGFSSFMAGQVVADLRHGLDGAWRDRFSWAPMGPGSMRGLNRYNGRPIETKIEQHQFLEQMVAAWEDVGRRLKTSMPLGIEAIDFQNCLCEFDKYERVLNGEGRPKSLYNGRG